MTAACLLCGCLLESPPDPLLDAQRTQREVHAIGNVIAEHLNQAHAQLFGVLFSMGQSLFALGMFAHCSSGDTGFNEAVGNMHEQLKDFVNKKITPGQLPPRPGAVQGKKIVIAPA